MKTAIGYLACFILLNVASASPSEFDVRTFGARGDGRTNDQAAIQRAVDSCAVSGGTVVFPPGTYLTGSIDLRSNVGLRVSRGAIILGHTDLRMYRAHTPKLRSYNDLFLQYSLFYAEGDSNISISGEGTIDGQGASFPVVTKAKPERYRNRPFVIRFVQCRSVSVTGVTLKNSAMWMQQYLACEGVLLRGITVFNHANQNNDMMDIDGCRNVVISDCIGDTEDDAITLKSTSPFITENVVVTNCVVSSHCNAIKTGTESTGGFRNISISNIVVKPSAVRTATVGFPDGISGITLATVDGGILENVRIQNIVMDGPNVPIFIRLGNRARPHDPAAPAPGIGRVRDIVISDVTAVHAGPFGCSVTGLPGHPVEQIRLERITMEFRGGGTRGDAQNIMEEKEKEYPEGTAWGHLPAYGIVVRHVNGIVLRDLEMRTTANDDRPAIVGDDVQGLTIGDVRAAAGAAAEYLVGLRDVRNARISDVYPASRIPSLVHVTGSRSAGIHVSAHAPVDAAVMYRTDVPGAVTDQTGKP